VQNHSWHFTPGCAVGLAARLDGGQDRVEHIFKAIDDILRQHADNQVTALLKLEVLTSITAVRFRVLKVVVAVDLDDHPQGLGSKIDFDSPSRPEWKTKLRVEPEEARCFGMAS
jgi:hypothetical protein